jgi:hypothetical protein
MRRETMSKIWGKYRDGDWRVDDWRPIESAPKDGTFCLLTGGAFWDQDFETFVVDNQPQQPAVVGFWLDYCWCYAFWDSEWRSVYYNPTHWMPLPGLPR